MFPLFGSDGDRCTWGGRRAAELPWRRSGFLRPTSAFTMSTASRLHRLRQAFNELAPGTQGGDHDSALERVPGDCPGNQTKRSTTTAFSLGRVCRMAGRNAGRRAEVTFTTEFSEYLQALAEAGVAPLKAEIANWCRARTRRMPTCSARVSTRRRQARPRAARRFVAHLADNPWNNGRAEFFA